MADQDFNPNPTAYFVTLGKFLKLAKFEGPLL